VDGDAKKRVMKTTMANDEEVEDAEEDLEKEEEERGGRNKGEGEGNCISAAEQVHHERSGGKNCNYRNQIWIQRWMGVFMVCYL